MSLKQPLLYVCLGFILIFVAGCDSAESNESADMLVYGLTLRPSGIDPHIHQSAELGIPLRQVYDTLVYRDPNTGEITAGLATNWQVSEDSLTYTFSLRQDVIFHDGERFNAQAVAANLDRITDNSDPRTASQRAQFLLGPYLRYEIIDDYTIQLMMAEPFAPLLDSLSQVYLGMASPSALAEYDRDTYQFHQVGTGPYKFVEYLPGEQIVLERNADYAWGPGFYNLESSALQQITYRFYEDPPTRLTALESGDVAVIGELLPSDARALIGNSNYTLLPTSVPGMPLQFFLNTTQYPTDNLVFRQALLLATNRTVIVDTLFQGFSPVAWGPLSAETLYYSPDVRDTYAYDPEQARELLASIGFVDADDNGYLDAGDGDLEVTIVHPSWGLLPETVQIIRDQWREVGIKAVLNPVPGFGALRAEGEAGDYNLIAFDSAGYDPIILNEFYASAGTNNYANYDSAEMDSLLRQATSALSPSVRRGLYAQIQALIMNEALILPIRDYVNLNAALANVQALEYDAYGWFPIMQNVTLAVE